MIFQIVVKLNMQFIEKTCFGETGEPSHPLHMEYVYMTIDYFSWGDTKGGAQNRYNGPQLIVPFHIDFPPSDEQLERRKLAHEL